MPEGPSIVILKELVMPFKNQKVIDVTGTASINADLLLDKKVIDFKSWGKHFLICFKDTAIRVHLMLFGTYSINEQTKPNKSVRLALHFKTGDVYFYNCLVKQLDGQLDELYDWSADVMNDTWSPPKALKKITTGPPEKICDVLLDQNIFSGAGNIIKNEVLYRVKLHPESITEKIPLPVLKALIKETRTYSFGFLKWKKEGTLKKHWQAYSKKNCPRCNIPISKKDTGKKKRSSYFCNNCQIKY